MPAGVNHFTGPRGSSLSVKRQVGQGELSVSRSLQVRVSEMWLSSCLDDVAEVAKSQETSFVMGWPTTNVIASFRYVPWPCDPSFLSCVEFFLFASFYHINGYLLKYEICR